MVTLAAKRARELTDGEPCLAESTHATDKPVSLAFYEIAEGEVIINAQKKALNKKKIPCIMIQGIFKRRRKMRGKHIIVAVSAGIAAYKAIEVVSRLVKKVLK